MAGRYDNDFVVEDGRWRFAHVRVRPALAAAHRSGWITLGDPDCGSAPFSSAFDQE